jgi:putative toxin-antitoxin system antitoxin component (TIGR02293 family)
MTVTAKSTGLPFGKPVPSKSRTKYGREHSISDAAPFDVLDFAGIFHASPFERIELIKRGVDARKVIELATRLDTSQEHLMTRLGLPRATIVRKSKTHQNLSTEQTERIVGLSRLIGQVQAMVEQSGDPEEFDAAHWVANWIERPNPALGGRLPADLMDTVGGQELVGSVLSKMQSGAYA